MISASPGCAPAGPSYLLNFALVLASPMVPQDGPSSTAVDPGGSDRVVAAEVLKLSLEDAAQLALGANLEYQIAELQTDIAEYDMLGSWGAFDWVFDAAAGVTDNEFATGPNPNFGLDQGRVTDFEVEPSFDIDFTKPLTTGGTFTAHFDTVIGADSRTSQVFMGMTAIQNNQGVTTDTLRLSYVQPLRRGAWSDYATSTQRESEVGYRKQVEVRRAARQKLLFDVGNAYWDLVSAQAQLDVARSSKDLGRQQLDQNQRRLDAGVGTAVDVLQAQAEVASRVETELQRENEVEQAMDVLKAQLFGGPELELWNVRIEPTSTLPEGELSTQGLQDWSQVLNVALEERSDLRQQRLEIEMARLRHGRTVSERLAGIDLDLSATSRNVDPSNSEAFNGSLGFEFPAYSATIRYNMPIGNRTADNAERAARAGVRSATLTYDQTEIGAVSEVRSAVRGVRYQVEAVRAAVQSLELAQRQLEAEEARYEADLSTTFQVLEFQQSLIEALSNERMARAEYVKALIALENASGTIEKPEAP